MNFWQFFRFIFVVFSLYLLGDAFFRWDGFSYYASFSEFLPSVALASILWSLIALLAAIMAWLPLRLYERLRGLFNWKVSIEHVLLYTGIFVLLGALVWKGKKILWPDMQTTLQVKTAVFISVSAVAVLLTWPLRGCAGRLTDVIHERLTPLVWFFGLFVMVSVPLVAYHAWLKDAAGKGPEAVAVTDASGRNRPNIILVSFDALTARNMSVYGYKRDTTPFITEWAKNATLFTRAKAGSNFTTPAVASLMTGKRVWTHQTYHIEGTSPVRSGAESLPSLTRGNGYFNIALVVNPFASVGVLGMSDSFDIAPPASDLSRPASLFGWKFGTIDNMLYRAFGEKIRLHNWILKNEFIFGRFLNLISRNITQTTVPPDKVFDRFLDIIDDNIQTPFFAWIHLFPPHDPYLPPVNQRGAFNPSSELRSYKEQQKLIENSYTYLFQYQPYPEDMQMSVNLMRDYYDEYIRYIDNEFGKFIREFNNRQIENTVIILTADHGESFDHGYFTHGGPFLYEEVTNIPLIIRAPGQSRGEVINDVVDQVDIAPTIMDMVDIPSRSWMDGRSLVPLMRGDHLPDRPAFSMNFQDNRSRGDQISRGSIAVWEGDYKLIHYIENKESLLFDLKHDPHEMNNLFTSEGETGEYLLGLIRDNLEDKNKRIIGK